MAVRSVSSEELEPVMLKTSTSGASMTDHAISMDFIRGFLGAGKPMFLRICIKSSAPKMLQNQGRNNTYPLLVRKA